jgi:hypothetical protein
MSLATLLAAENFLRQQEFSEARAKFRIRKNAEGGGSTGAISG